MSETLGKIVFRSRSQLNLTQDEFGARYSVSGPAIFKFEKDYVRPSLALWLAIASDAELTERRAVILWLRAKLPPEYQAYLELPSARGKKRGRRKAAGPGGVDYADFEEMDDMRAAARTDKNLPKALRDLLEDTELWELFKPSGHEINLLRDMIAPLGKGSKAQYGDALRLIREFTYSF